MYEHIVVGKFETVRIIFAQPREGAAADDAFRPSLHRKKLLRTASAEGGSSVRKPPSPFLVNHPHW